MRNVRKKKIRVVHIPFSGRNPYQKLLADRLKTCGIDVNGSSVHHVKDISFLNLSLLFLLVEHGIPDIIHLHWRSSFFYVDGSRSKTVLKSFLFICQILILRVLRIKLVWTVHNLKRHEKTYRDLETRFTKILAKLSDGIIVHCQTAKDEFRRSVGKKNSGQIFIIPHGHFVDYYPDTTNREAACRQMGIPSSDFIFLFLGELRYYKGVLDLVDAFRRLNGTGIRLVIAGRPYDRRIRDEVTARTTHVRNITTHYTFVPDQELQQYIRASDIMVFPYRNIFTSGGIFMALSFGKPIIAPELGCIADVLDGTPNFIYDATEKNGLIDSMRTAIESKKQLGSIGRYNRDLADRFDWQKIAQKTSEAYRKCLAK